MKVYLNNINQETILKTLFILLNTFNILYFTHATYNIWITLLLFAIYYKLSNLHVNKKQNIILTWILFSLFTITGESFFIYHTNALHYTNTELYNVPIWLFGAYANMVLSVFGISDFLN